MGTSIVFTDLSWNDLWFMAEGAGRTLNLTVWSCLCGTILGLGIGTARASWPVVVSAIFGVYVDVLRSVPLLIRDSPRWLLPIADNGSTMGIRPRIRP